MIDFKTAADIGLWHITEWLPNGKKVGHEWKCLNPKRDDKTIGSFSVNLNTGEWADFATGDKGGDTVSLYAYLNGVTQAEAAQAILGENPKAQAPAPKPKEAEWEPIYPVPASAGKLPKLTHFKYGEPVAHWVYRDSEGKPMFIIARYKREDGGKEIVPWSYCHKAGKYEWRQKNHPGPRPLYNLQELSSDPKKPVLIVEGEGCAETARSVLEGKLIATTWPGGSNAAKKANWSILTGRDVFIWPDMDKKPNLSDSKQPGMMAALDIFNEIKEDTKSVKILRPPSDVTDGWDITDAVRDGWTLSEVMDLIGPLPGESSDVSPDSTSRAPFRALGHDHGTYYFLSGRTKDIIAISSNQMKKNQFLSLAPLSYWEVEYPGKQGPEWDMVVDALIHQCQMAGKYNQDKIRGRGAWLDEGEIILHLGDRIVSKGKEVELQDFKSKWIYEIRPSMNMPKTSPAKTEDTKKILESFAMLNWERPIDAYLAAGWCVVAPICGALEWRPHTWITGPAGSGKSWVMDRMVRPLLGNTSIYTLGKSTEAGIRQKLSNDAIPVVIDEAESDDKGQAEHIQHILTLMRQASSGSENGDTTILKGTVSGRQLQFTIRSCFMLSSIGVGVQHRADETRVSVVSLKVDTRDDSRERFKALQLKVDSIFKTKFMEAARARTVELIPIIRANTKVFSEAAASLLKNQRLGDQIGALLAGAYSLASSKEITREIADKFLEGIDFREEEERSSVTDEDTCLQTIIQSQLRIVSEGKQVDVTVGELIQRVAVENPQDERVISSQNEAELYLKRNGIRYIIETKDVVFASAHDGIRAMLRNTAWPSNYSRMLKRINGSKNAGQVRFTAGVRQYAVSIPIKIVLKTEADG